ncbi:MAG: nuclear transport factor 2 family protein [Blastomonas fulva]|uniref:nuclear transport factor 2 family protein n=1 Tax=Blastomonas fulva TaxID=1550728 RepID=UPI0024E1EA2E|nr:nuclear transport factor 2 family protein [Blastomonas fulva]MDK2758680.1 nuclear transport factor 2 family protein [Blastomonas fulva]
MTSPAFSDWLDICSLKARYCRCLDTKDWQGYAEVFADDAVLDTSPSGGLTVAGRDALVAYVRSSISEDTITTHHIHAPEIAIDGDTATGIWAMQDRNIWPNGRKLLGFGHYHERYVRTADGWRIAESSLTRINMEMTNG